MELYWIHRQSRCSRFDWEGFYTLPWKIQALSQLLFMYLFSVLNIWRNLFTFSCIFHLIAIYLCVIFFYIINKSCLLYWHVEELFISYDHLFCRIMTMDNNFGFQQMACHVIICCLTLGTLNLRSMSYSVIEYGRMYSVYYI